MIELAAQSGPRGAVFAGRRIRPGGVPDLKDLMTQLPTDIPEEGYGALPSINPAILRTNSWGNYATQPGPSKVTPPKLVDTLRRYMGFETELAHRFEDEKARREQNAR